MDKRLPFSPAPLPRAQVPLVVIIILSWDSIEDTLACLRSALCSDYPNFEILVVDNAQQPGLGDILQRDFPEVYLLRNPENLGYAAGNNRGIGWALEQGAQWVLLLNDDITLEPDTCRLLVELAAQDLRVAAAGGKVRPKDQPGKLWAAGEAFERQQPVVEDKGQFNTPQAVRYVAGCCILLSRIALAKIGLFDELYFMLAEEKDWCQRAIRAGFSIRYHPQAVAWHDLRDSLGVRQSPLYHYLYVRNNLYFWQKFSPQATLQNRQRKIIDLIWQEIQFIYRHGKQRLRRSEAALRGAQDFLSGRFGPPPGDL